MNQADVTAYILATYPETDAFTYGNATFYSLDPDKHWPNFATLITADDEYDSFSNLNRPGVYRLNIGLSKQTFERLVGSIKDPDYAVLDRVIPHPVYATQHWVSILNPRAETFDDVVKPLLAEAYERVARGHRKKAGSVEGG